MNSLVLGWRNLRRNFRRTLVTALSVVCAFAALGLFSGYVSTVYESLENQAIHGELLGHLTIVKHGFRQEGRLDPSRFLLDAKEVAQVTHEVLQALPDAQVMPRLGINGLISNGRVSTIFIAEGLAPKDMRTLRGPRVRASGLLQPDDPTGITVARGLAEMLALRESADSSLLVSTMHGQANALDAHVADTFSTGNVATENKFLYLPLALAQSLYDAEGRADRLTLLLPRAADTEQAKALLAKRFKEHDLKVDVETWDELSSFYRQVKSLFDMVFGFLLSIVMVIILMSVGNAMSMNVVERTREIGTLRAIGVKGSGVIELFVVEALLLVVSACAIGLVVTLAVSWGINHAQIAYRPPNSTDEVPLVVGFDAMRVGLAGVALCVLCAVAAFVPARRASRQSIVEALIHV